MPTSRACRHVEFGRDQAPEEYREAMIADVPLHRDLMEVWGALGRP